MSGRGSARGAAGAALLVAALWVAGGAGAQPWSLEHAPASWLGPAAEAGAGRVFPVGDLDGDGVGEVAIGAPHDDADGPDAGRVYLFSGSAALHRNVELATADVVIGGAAPADLLGWAVAGVGDVNGDGFGDLAVGAPLHRVGDGSGTVFLFFGPWDTWPADRSIDDADVRIGAEQLASGFGMTIAAAGDVNGTGFDDLWIAAPYARQVDDDPNAVELDEFKRGAVFLVPGREIWPPEPRVDETAHLIFRGVEQAAMFGSALAAGRDLDDNGVPDLCVGAPGTVLDGLDWRGVVTCYTRLRMLPAGDYAAGAGDLKLVGGSQGDTAGWSLAAADLDGDGVADLVASAPYRDAGGPDRGGLVARRGGPGFGQGSQGWQGDLFELLGDVDDGAFGYALASAGDLDGDGDEELLIGAPGIGEAGEGGAYLLDGRPGGEPWPGLAMDTDRELRGRWALDRAGTHVAGLDPRPGFPDGGFAIGSVHAAHAGDDAGKVWLLRPGLDEDDDGDGFSELEGDCRDDDPDSHPGADAGDAVDDDCDGLAEDGGDCDDSCADCFPGAPEIVDGLDNDCDGEIDEGPPPSPDDDADGWSVDDGDCDDGDDGVFPGAAESCDGRDENCNGVIDDGVCGDDDDTADDDDSAAPDETGGCDACATGDGTGSIAAAGATVCVVLPLALLGRRLRGARRPR